MPADPGFLLSQDGGEEVVTAPVDDGKTKAWHWKFNKSPMGELVLNSHISVSNVVKSIFLGSGEFYLMQQGSEKVHMIVRTINSAAFSSHDWEEFVVTVRLPFFILPQQFTEGQHISTSPPIVILNT